MEEMDAGSSIESNTGAVETLNRFGGSGRAIHFSKMDLERF